jgi:hypothetical protein
MSNDPYPYGQQPAYAGATTYGQEPGRRPGTVTAGAWIAIVFSGLTGLLFAGIAGAFALAPDEFRDSFQDEWNNSGGTDVQIDVDSVIGVVIAVFLGFAVWCLIAVVLAVFVLRRSNVARILLVISSGVAAAISLVGIGSGVSIVWLGASVATIVLVFVGGAGNWFKGLPAEGGYGGGYQQYGQQYGQEYGQQQYGAQSTQQYGQQPPSSEPGESGGSEYPPKDYPRR